LKICKMSARAIAILGKKMSAERRANLKKSRHDGGDVQLEIPKTLGNKYPSKCYQIYVHMYSKNC